mgnify:CR=1 FL=1
MEGGGAVYGGGRVQGVTYRAQRQIPYPQQIMSILEERQYLKGQCRYFEPGVHR